MKEKIPPIVLFGEFQRKDPAERIVEGYCYVNAKVGDGWDLTREAMEAATAEYMRWANIREMHQPNAVGVALETNWDEKGCFMRAKIVDDATWKKVEEGVLKGFSVRGVPTFVRGKQIKACKWIETSLVDRPHDPDTPISISRAEDADSDIECKFEVARGDFLEGLKAMAPGVLTRAAFERLHSEICYYCLEEGDSNKAMGVIDDFKTFILPLIQAKQVQRSEDAFPFANLAADGVVSFERAAGFFAAHGLTLPDTSVEIARLEGELTSSRESFSRLQQEKEAADAEVTRLSNLPRSKRPVVNTAAFERSLIDQEAGETDTSEVTALKTEYDQVVERVMKEPDESKRQDCVVAMSRLKGLLAEKGVRV
jgi:hypothetical protein